MMDISGLGKKIRRHEPRVGVIGLGYVGLLLALAFAERGFSVPGFDIDGRKTGQLSRGESYIRHIGRMSNSAQLADGRLLATNDLSRLSEVDTILICGGFGDPRVRDRDRIIRA